MPGKMALMGKARCQCDLCNRLTFAHQQRLCSLYPALERLLNKGWVKAKWAETPTKRQARYYTITRSGRAQLEDKISEYDRIASAIAQVMAKA